MGVSSIPASGGGGLRPRYQKFTSSGTFTLPDGYGAANPLLINIQVIGGGGGGSGYPNQNPTGLTATAIAHNRNSYFGGNYNFNWSNSTDIGGRPGGSGGLAATQMYLTGNLTITVGAAGTGGGKTVPVYNGPTGSWQDNNNGASNPTPSWYNNITGGISSLRTAINTMINAAAMNATGGTGGTSTAGSVSAGGGNAGQLVLATGPITNDTDFNNTGGSSGVNVATRNIGTGGTPSGTAGDATPLLGTIAGGSTNATSVFGSFGIGGKQGDNTTSTGVEGTGGGAGSIGASGAVIITWWQ